MDSILLMTRFQQLERDLGLFQQTVKGEPWWDSVRYDVHTFLGSVLLGRGIATPSAQHHLRRVAARALAGAMRAKLFQRLSRKQDRVLLIRAPRYRENGVNRDIIIDPVGALFSHEICGIDTFPRRHHVPFYQKSRRSGSVPCDMGNTIAALLDTFEIKQDCADELERIIRFRRFAFEAEVRGYGQLLARARPRMIILVQNGIEKALFKVAGANGIPTAELQHGLMGYAHPAYSYPEDVDYSGQGTFPDLFLSFSEFWDRSCHYPAGDRIPIGNDSYFVKTLPVNPDGKVMVVSTGVHHSTLAKWIREIAVLSPNRQIIYKLHPGQQPRFHQIVTEFGDLPNIEVYSGHSSPQTLLKQVSHVIGICSTVMYEALQAGRTVCIIPQQDYLVHADILQTPGVLVTPTPEDLDRALDNSGTVGSPRFFDPFDADRARTVIESAMQPANKKRRGAS